MKLVFAGTPDFARCALQQLHAAGHAISLVLTQPDRPAGRGMKLQASPVKQFAVEQGLPVAQPRSLRLDGRFPDDAQAARAALLAAAPDAMIVAAYGLILPRWVLDLPRLGCLNIHASLLPRWRGAAPIHRAIEAGDAQTGITIMQMDEGLDTGDMLLAGAQAIRPDDTTATLHDRLATQGAELIMQALDRLAGHGSPLQRAPQPGEGVSYAHKIDKAEARIDWRLPAATIERRVRAFDPFPGASFDLPALPGGGAGETLKLWRAAVVPMRGRPGEVLAADARQWVVACGEQALSLLELQRAGGRRQPVSEFMRQACAAVLQPGLRLPLDPHADPSA